jgi:hypothetical protein
MSLIVATVFTFEMFVSGFAQLGWFSKLNTSRRKAICSLSAVGVGGSHVAPA